MDEIYESKYPDFRFSCSNCGSLEVLVSRKNTKSLKGRCLDCGKNWTE